MKDKRQLIDSRILKSVNQERDDKKLEFGETKPRQKAIQGYIDELDKQIEVLEKKKEAWKKLGEIQ